MVISEIKQFIGLAFSLAVVLTGLGIGLGGFQGVLTPSDLLSASLIDGLSQMPYGPNIVCATLSAAGFYVMARGYPDALDLAYNWSRHKV